MGERGAFKRVVIEERSTVVCEICAVADTPTRRMKGLLGRKQLPAGEGILIRPTSAIHTWFMRFPIDVVFLDSELRVLDVASELKPWRAAARRRARAVLELAAGECSRRGLQPGDRLRVVHAR
jgi:uncharacterized membrane protein (UPF0127 family)